MGRAIFLFIIPVMFFFFCSGKPAYEEDDVQDETVVIEDDGGDDPVVRLESLTVSTGEMSPAFSPDIYYYDISLTSDIRDIRITARPHEGCTIQISDAELSPSNYTAVIEVNRRLTEVPIFVSVENYEGYIYSLRILRAEDKPVANRSFELFNDNNYPEEWNMTGAGELRSSSDFFRTGLSSGIFTTLTSSIGGREVLSAPVGIEQGFKIVLSAWFYLPYMEGVSAERANVSLKLFYYRDEQCSLSASTPYSTMAKEVLENQGVWEMIHFERMPDLIPSDAAFVRIALRACYDSTNGGTKYDKIYFDDVSLQQ